jgi:hypothetical protein
MAEDLTTEWAVHKMHFRYHGSWRIFLQEGFEAGRAAIQKTFSQKGVLMDGLFAHQDSEFPIHSSGFGFFPTISPNLFPIEIWDPGQKSLLRVFNESFLAR